MRYITPVLAYSYLLTVLFAHEAIQARKIMVMPRLAAIVVDVQADFMQLPIKLTSEEMATKRYIKAPVGALAVEGTGADYLQAVTEATQQFRDHNIPIIFTQDWHPAGHISFASRWKEKGGEAFKPLTIKNEPGISDRVQVLWPDHCVQRTPGAAILVPQEQDDVVIQKGTDRNNDSYSGFKDDSGVATLLRSTLERLGATDLIVYGIATDYCVQATALHGIEAGFKVHLIVNLSRGVEPGTSRAALQRMHEKNIKLYTVAGLHDGMSEAFLQDIKDAGIPIQSFPTIAEFITFLRRSPQERMMHGAKKMARQTGMQLGMGMEKAGKWLQQQAQS